MGVAALVGVVMFLVIAAALLFALQARMIYFPRAYNDEYRLFQPGFAREVKYTTSQGRQQALYVPPRETSATLPAPLWVMFHGNAALALDWYEIVQKSRNPRAGFLLIDYPGYGFCEGKPSPEAILESSLKALDALAGELKVEPEQIKNNLSLCGVSLGTAAALQLACKTQPERVVLIAPFSCMLDMAQRTVGWPMCQLLTHRFDNTARLAELAQRPNRPHLVIIHGDEDQLVPVEMSRQAARMHADWIEYHEIKRADHNWILDAAEKEIMAALFPQQEGRAQLSQAAQENRPAK